MQVTLALHRASLLQPDHTFTICGDRIRTVEQVHNRVARLAAGLVDLGVGQGDRVGILALNSDRYVEYLLAVPWAGGVINPVNIRWSPAEIAYSLADCQTEVLLVDDTFAGMVPLLRQSTSQLRAVIFCGDGATPADLIGYEDLIASQQPVADACRQGEDLYGIFYTGGTTGQPKGVMLSHDNVLVSAMGGLATGEVLTRGGVLLHAAPMFHLADLAAWAMGMLVGSTHVTIPAFSAAGVIEAIEAHAVNDMLLVPTMIQMLIEAPELTGRHLPTVRRIIYGASPINEAVLRRAFEVLPNSEFTQGYGMTELSPMATMLLPEDHREPSLLRSAGRPVVHASVRIVDPTGTELEPGAVGEICVRGDNVMQGYWNQPSQTAEAIRDGWMHTGDGGYLDDRGYLFVVDRIKDMIISGGENIYSAEVENALVKHPAVAQCAVIAVPDADWGERVHAVIVRRAGAQPDAAELQAFCRTLIAGYKVPRSFDFVEALPMSAAGKVLKRELRDARAGSSTQNT